MILIQVKNLFYRKYFFSAREIFYGIFMIVLHRNSAHYCALRNGQANVSLQREVD
jgi:hypothetical protein